MRLLIVRCDPCRGRGRLVDFRGCRPLLAQPPANRWDPPGWALKQITPVRRGRRIGGWWVVDIPPIREICVIRGLI